MTRRIPPVVLVVIALCALSGCSLRKPAPEWNGYLIAPTRPAAEPEGSAGPLRIASVRVAEAYSGSQLIVRTGEFTYEPDFFQRFLAPPDAMIEGAMVAWLTGAGFGETAFRTRTGPASSVLVLEAHVAELYADARAPGAAAAVLAVDVQVTRSGSAAPSLDRRYAERVPVPAATAEAMVAGLNDAMARILTRLEADLRALR